MVDALGGVGRPATLDGRVQGIDRSGPPPSATIRPAYAILLLYGLLSLLDGADGQTLAISAPLLSRTLGMTNASVGLLFSCALLGNAVGAVGGGLVADRWGSRSLAAASALIVGVFQLATHLVHDLPSLLFVRFLVGIGLGGMTLSVSTVAAQVIPGGCHLRIQGLIWAGSPLGAVIGGFSGSWILAHGAWQNIFVFTGVATLLAAVAVWFIGPVSVRRPAREREDMPGLGAPLAGGLWQRTVLLATVFFFTFGAMAALMNWTPSLLVREGFSAAEGALISGWGAAGALISMIASGFVVERYKFTSVIIGLTVAAIGYLLFALSLPSALAVSLISALLGACSGFSGTAVVLLAGELFPVERRASGIGICMAVARVGQMTLPGLFGVALQAGGSTQAVLILMAVPPACGAIATVLLAARLKMAWPRYPAEIQRVL